MADFKDLVPNWAEASQCILYSRGKTVLHWPFLKAIMPCNIRISSYCWYLWRVPSRHRKWMEARTVTEGTKMEVFQLYKFLWVGSVVWIKMECFMSGELPYYLCYSQVCSPKIREVVSVPVRKQHTITDSTSHKFE